MLMATCFHVRRHSWPSVSMAFASVDSINHRLKVGRKMLFVLGTNRFFYHYSVNNTI